ncbi:MAG: glycosyl transferase family 90 [Pseudomonadota bacterium]
MQQADTIMHYSCRNKRLHKLDYYLSAFFRGVWARQRASARIAKAMRRYHDAPEQERAYIDQRVNYYNRLREGFDAGPAESVVSHYRRGKSWAYHLDFKPLVSCFPGNYRFDELFGDVVHVPERPTFVKSRPIREDGSNANSVLLKLNRLRHYYMPRDPVPFDRKKPMAVWRGKAFREKRERFVESCFANPLCDVGDVRKSQRGKPWYRPFMSVQQQLDYRYVLSVEGKDVATNVKWIMASNSACVMAPPKFETWFMEGKLTPGKHYIALREDYADLDEKLHYYNENTDALYAIVQNANAYTAQFMDEEREFLIGLLVMDKYFRCAGYPSVLGLGDRCG